MISRIYGFGDDGPLGVPGAGFAYTLSSGTVVYLPPDWNSLPNLQKLLWIESSDLSSADALLLEDEAGVTDLPVGYDPFTHAPSSTTRPSYDYVRGGDVVRVTIPLSSGIYLQQGDVLSAIANAVRTANLSYVSGSLPGAFGGSMTIDVQPQNDFSHLSDVASIVQAQAQGAGGLTTSGPASAAFVSRVESTGGTIQAASLPPQPDGGGSSITLAQLGLVAAVVILGIVIVKGK